MSPLRISGGGGGGGGGRAIPQLYQSAARDMGFLTLQGGEILVPIDGQHRAKAFKFAIDGTDDNNRPLPGVTANQNLAKEQVTVILVRFDTEKARRIFNKINRYAKATTASENRIIDDDDPIAVITRGLLDEAGVIPVRLVNISSNTLTAKAPEFTTLATLNSCNLEIVRSLKLVGSGSFQGMPPGQRDLAQEQVRQHWERLLSGIDLWAAALADTSSNGDASRIQIRAETLPGKPIGQLALVRAYLLMRERCEGVSEIELCQRLNRINWDVNAPMWHGVLMNPNGRVMSGRGAVNRACEFIAHLGGAKLTTEETGVCSITFTGNPGSRRAGICLNRQLDSFIKGAGQQTRPPP